MASATDGPFFLSVPNEPGLPFGRFGHRFEHHVRHFHRAELLEMLRCADRTRVVAEYGQQVYQVNGDTFTGLVDEAEMGLRPFEPETSQFLVMIVERS